MYIRLLFSHLITFNLFILVLWNLSNEFTNFRLIFRFGKGIGLYDYCAFHRWRNWRALHLLHFLEQSGLLRLLYCNCFVFNFFLFFYFIRWLSFIQFLWADKLLFIVVFVKHGAIIKCVHSELGARKLVFKSLGSAHGGCNFSNFIPKVIEFLFTIRCAINMLFYIRKVLRSSLHQTLRQTQSLSLPLPFIRFLSIILLINRLKITQIYLWFFTCIRTVFSNLSGSDMVIVGFEHLEIRLWYYRFVEFVWDVIYFVCYFLNLGLIVDVFKNWSSVVYLNWGTWHQRWCPSYLLFWLTPMFFLVSWLPCYLFGGNSCAFSGAATLYRRLNLWILALSCCWRLKYVHRGMRDWWFARAESCMKLDS